MKRKSKAKFQHLDLIIMKGRIYYQQYLLICGMFLSAARKFL